jgi:glycosyltransferase involved in cell wall biosynthesis
MKDSSQKSRDTISAFIVCKNEENSIRRALESVSWCDEIVIVDSGSTDNTLEICREFTQKIIFREWSGYSEQKFFALKLCTSDWILNLDADEEVSIKLRNSIHDMLEKHQTEIDGYNINRVVFYLNRWWRNGGWYPEYRLRVCRRSKTSWGGSNIHEKAIVKGKTEKLIGELHHFTYEDIAEHIRVVNRYSSLLTEETSLRKGDYLLPRMIIHPITRFIKHFILKHGYRDGIAGLIVATTESFYVFMKYAKVWEYRLNNKK